MPLSLVHQNVFGTDYGYTFSLDIDLGVNKILCSILLQVLFYI